MSSACPHLVWIVVLGTALVSGPAAGAGFVGWITAKERSWAYVRQTGGLRISQPTLRSGKMVLPVDYDATGVSGVTTRPTVVNAGQAVRRIDVERVGHAKLVLTVITQVVEATSPTGRVHFVELGDLPAGPYDAYYGDSQVAAQWLGKIHLPP